MGGPLPPLPPQAQEAVLPEWIQAVESTVTLQELATGRNVLDIHAGDCCSPPHPRWLQQGAGGGEVTKRDEKKLETRVGTTLLMTDKVKMPGEWKAEISASTRDETLHVGGGWAQKYRKTILY